MLVLAWAPLILLYTMLVSFSIWFAGAAINVYYRHVGAVLPYAALPAYVPSRVPPDLLKNARYEQQRTAARDLQGLSVARCHKDGIADVQVEAQSYQLVYRVCLATVATAAAAVRAQLTISRIS